MKLHTTCVSLAICLNTLPAVLGQTSLPRHQVTGDTYIPPTPQQDARNSQIGSLDRAAAAALDAGDYATAEADARRALSLGLDPGVAQQVLAWTLDAQGRDQEALQQYTEMASRGYNPPDVMLPYALLLLKAGQWAQAVDAYDKALPYIGQDGDLVRSNSDFSPDVPEPVILATAIHVALGAVYDCSISWGGHSRNGKALAEFQKAVSLEPDSPLANYFYGQGLQKLGRTAQARAAFQKTVKIAKGGVKLAAQKALAQAKKPV